MVQIQYLKQLHQQVVVEPGVHLHFQQLVEQEDLVVEVVAEVVLLEVLEIHLKLILIKVVLEETQHHQVVHLALMLAEVVEEPQLLDQMQLIVMVQQEEQEHLIIFLEIVHHTLVVEVVELKQTIQEQVVLVVEVLELDLQELLEQLTLVVEVVELVVVELVEQVDQVLLL